MFKYIKWDLIDEFRKKKLIIGFIALIYVLVFLLPEDSSIMKYLYIPMTLILLGSFFMIFISGAKKTMDSYQSQTFLLESMIPLSPNKILFAKYIIAIIFNVLYCIIFVLGLSVVLAKADINLIKELLEYFYSLKIDEWLMLIRVFVFLISSSIATTSVTTLVFLMLKSTFPNGKGLRIISFIVSGIIMNIITSTFLSGIKNLILESEIGDIYFSISLLVLATIGYFASVWFVKNKLEIYN